MLLAALAMVAPKAMPAAVRDAVSTIALVFGFMAGFLSIKRVLIINRSHSGSRRADGGAGGQGA